MAEFFFVVMMLLVFVAVMVAASGFGVYFLARSAKRSTDRVRSKISLTVPASAVARQPWWYIGRIDHATERADYARRVAAGTAFATEVGELARQVDHGAAVLRRSVRTTRGLAGNARTQELNRLEHQIAELEQAAGSLIDLAVTAAQRQSWSGANSPATDVMRRTQAYLHALAELDDAEFGDLSVQAEVQRAASANPIPPGSTPPSAPPALDAAQDRWVPPAPQAAPQPAPQAQPTPQPAPRRRPPTPA